MSASSDQQEAQSPESLSAQTALDRAPARQLQDVKLEDGWKVIEFAAAASQATGGYFSQGYIVEKDDGTRAFLKALDFRSALRQDDPATALYRMTKAFKYERLILDRCGHLSRIVSPLASGTVRSSDTSDDNVVQYIIFELAEYGDVRKYLDDAGRQLDAALAFRFLHQIATALAQLHGVGVAHQDLKPSNVLVFAEESTKLCDLGRAAYEGHESESPWEELTIPGDLGYAPPELLYGHVEADQRKRRLSCDLYLLGNMVVFFFARVSMTSLLRQELYQSHVWREWPGSFAEVKPYLREAFGRATEHLRDAVDSDFTEETLEIVRQLCDPDPELRGHPRSRVGLGSPYSLERYISRFDLLARKAAMKLGCR